MDTIITLGSDTTTDLRGPQTTSWFQVAAQTVDIQKAFSSNTGHRHQLSPSTAAGPLTKQVPSPAQKLGPPSIWIQVAAQVIHINIVSVIAQASDIDMVQPLSIAHTLFCASLHPSQPCRTNSLL